MVNLKEAKSYGDAVQILASPWSPPASMKTNGSTIDGGKLKTDSYGAYASYLNDYVKYMAGQGITIDVVSIQNEPDWHPSYDSCDWSGDEFKTFLKNKSLVDRPLESWVLSTGSHDKIIADESVTNS